MNITQARMAMLIAGSVLAWSAPSWAQDSAAEQKYDAAVEAAKSTYKLDKEACGPLSGNAQDVCVEEAKLKEAKAKAQAKVDLENTAKARLDAQIEVADAEHELAKEKCDDRSGNDKDVCVKQAKAKHAEAVNAAKAGKEIINKQEDTIEAKYKAEVEKCDSLAGDAKDGCVARAKSTYNQ